MRLHLSSDCPEEGGHFAGDCHRDDGLAFTVGHELAVAATESDLRLPVDVAHDFRQTGLSFLQQPTHASREPVRPSTLDEYASNPAIAGFRNAAASDPLAGRAFGRHQTEIRHQLARSFEAAHIANFGDEGDGGQESDATRRVEGGDNGRHGPGGHHFGNLPSQTLESDLGVLDRQAILRQHEILSRVVKGQFAQPSGMRLGPCVTTGEDPAMTEEKGLQVLTGAPQVLHRGSPAAHEFPYCLVTLIRHPDGCQFSSAVQFGQGRRIATIGLNPLARPPRDQRRRDYDALVAKPGDLTMQAIAGWSGLVAEGELLTPFGKLRYQTLNAVRFTVDVPDKAHLTVTSRLGDCHRDLQLRCIQIVYQIVETILDNLTGPDDSLFLYTYRDTTPSTQKTF
jgi:hypothetical protein